MRQTILAAKLWLAAFSILIAITSLGFTLALANSSFFSLLELKGLDLFFILRGPPVGTGEHRYRRHRRAIIRGTRAAMALAAQPAWAIDPTTE